MVLSGTTYDLSEVRDDAKCARCGGRCCKIYNVDSKKGFRDCNVWFEDWCIGFHTDRKTYGVEPLFDPLVTHCSGNEWMNKLLQSMGIDHEFCEYRDPKTGCMIPWEKRPKHCRTFKCPEWASK